MICAPHCVGAMWQGLAAFRCTVTNPYTPQYDAPFRTSCLDAQKLFCQFIGGLKHLEVRYKALCILMRFVASREMSTLSCVLDTLTFTPPLTFS